MFSKWSVVRGRDYPCFDIYRQRDSLYSADVSLRCLVLMKNIRFPKHLFLTLVPLCKTSSTPKGTSCSYFFTLRHSITVGRASHADILVTQRDWTNSDLLDPWKRKYQQDGENYMMKNFIICILLQILLWHSEFESRQPLWSSGQSSWLQIQRPGLNSRRHQIFWEVVGQERSPLSLVSTIEELVERKSSGSGLESREYGSRDPSRWPRGTLYPQKLTITSLTNSGGSVGIVR
jgi:hypothetical protein